MAKRRRNRSRYRKVRHTQKKLTRKPANWKLGLVSDLTARQVRKSNRITSARYDRINKLKGFQRLVRSHRETLRRSQTRRNGVLRVSPVSPIKKTKKQTICKNRAIRKQVLHALNKTGKSGQKPPVRRFPNIKCRRK